jgi:NAD(P)-dependent dehydrogenase (short-subunit alcohol dehydrogenase family)
MKRRTPMTKTWFITGASSGFGRLMIEKLLARGDRVAATIRKADALDGLKAIYGKWLSVILLDVTDSAAVRREIERAFAELGRIDVIVSNAGYAVFGAAEEASDAQVRHQIDTNLIGAMAVIRACLPHLRRQGGGRILQISSEGGQITYPAFSLYHASKWGIEGFVEAVAKEVAPFGIGLTLVEPGPTRTNFLSGMVQPAPMPEYENTPVGEMRRGVLGGGFRIVGDAAKMVDALIASADGTTAPLRLTLGSTAYTSVLAALTERQAALEAQRDVALATDADQ